MTIARKAGALWCQIRWVKPRFGSSGLLWPFWQKGKIKFLGRRRAALSRGLSSRKRMRPSKMSGPAPPCRYWRGYHRETFVGKRPPNCSNNDTPEEVELNERGNSPQIC